MRQVRLATTVLLIMGCGATFGFSAAAENPQASPVDYIHDPLPPGFQVVISELEGPVFADAAGHSLYVWPRRGSGTGYIGDPARESNCYDVHHRVTGEGGFSDVYPGGDELPDVDTRPTCVQKWPPVIAAPDAKPIGNWSTFTRTDGKKQWAYKDQALYTWHLDHQLGETSGGSQREGRNGGGDIRKPVGPGWAIPPQFVAASMAAGQMLTTRDGFSVYAFDKHTPNKVTPTESNCDDCVEEWAPVLAPESAIVQGHWSILQREGGTRQWAFRGMALYRHVIDSKQRSYEGSDVPGWQNVFLQHAPPPPRNFQVVDMMVGQVLAEAHGKTIYFYSCTEDVPDRLNCDEPTSPQVYRWAVCGGGDPARCVNTFPYVIAEKGAKSNSIAWSTMDIDPKSGRRVAAGAPGSLHVWAFQEKPIYTFARDREIGDIGADGWGENRGDSNGFSAFWVRDDYSSLDGTHDYGN